MADQVRAAIVESLDGIGSYVPPMKTLAGVTVAQARKRPKRGIATIWEQLAHMVFWQDIFLTRMRGQIPPDVPHDQDGWPKMPSAPAEQDEAWADLVVHFAAGLNEAEKIAKRATLGDKLGPKMKRTFAGQLLSLATHNAYHLGQIVTLRRMIDAWPPPSGGYTW
jgi:uncharacterized damage-inducible protein DinB